MECWRKIKEWGKWQREGLSPCDGEGKLGGEGGGAMHRSHRGHLAPSLCPS